MTRRELLQTMAAVGACSVLPTCDAAAAQTRFGDILLIAEDRGRATVASYRVHPNGDPLLLSRRALSLTAGEPTHVALSHDGRSVAVCSRQGRVVDLLTLGEDGLLSRVVAVHRRLRGATPVSVAFRKDGRLQMDGLLLQMRHGQLVEAAYS